MQFPGQGGQLSMVFRAAALTGGGGWPKLGERGQSPMSALSVELNGKEREFVEEQVARGVSSSPTEYVNELIRRQRFRAEELSDEDESDEDFAARMRARWAEAKARDPIAFQKAVERMHELIREGIESGPAVEMTPEEWEKLRRQVDETLTKQETIVRVQAMLVEGGQGEMTEVTRADLDDIRGEVYAQLAKEKRS